MRKLFRLLPVLALALWACKKDDVKCSSPEVQAAATQCGNLVNEVLTERLSNYTLYGRCDTCYTARLNQAAEAVNAISTVTFSEPECDTLRMQAQSAMRGIINGAGDFTADLDSQEVVNLKNRSTQTFADIVKQFQ